MYHTSVHWTLVLPVVLGQRTVSRKILVAQQPNQSTEESFCLPLSGQFFTVKDKIRVDNDFLHNFHQCYATPTSNHRKQHIFIFKELKTCCHIFLRVHAVKLSFHTSNTGTYEGPNKITRHFPFVSTERLLMFPLT